MEVYNLKKLYTPHFVCADLLYQELLSQVESI